MKKDDKTIDKLSSEKIKPIGLDEPSVDFTHKVMQTIIAEQPIYQLKQKTYWWMLSLTPILVGICWYLLAIFDLTGYLYSFWASVLNLAQPIISAISSLFTQLRNISIPPLFLIGFIAILSLLAIEEIISQIKHKSI